MFKETSFTNEFGQVIEPNDPVIFVSTASHQSAVEKGIYQGINCDDKHNITSVRVKRVESLYPWSSPPYVALPLQRVYKYIT